MASHPRQIRLIKQRLENLEQEKEHFLDVVTKHVEPVISLAKTWIEKQETTGASFQQVCGAIDRAIAYFFVVPAECDDGTEEGNFASVRAGHDPGLSLPSSPFTSSTGTSLPASGQDSTTSLDTLISSFQQRMDMLENTSNKTSHEAHSTAADVKEVTPIVHNLEERMCRLEMEKEAFQDKMKILEEKLHKAPSDPQGTQELQGKIERLETGLIRVKKLGDRLRESDEQRKTDLASIGDLASKVATYTEKIDTVKKRQRPTVGFAVRAVKEPGYDCYKSTTQNGVPIMDFPVILSNPGNHYARGVFTAPVDGLYHVKVGEVVCLSDKYYCIGTFIQVIQVPVNAEAAADKEWIVAGVSSVVRKPGINSDSMEIKLGMRAGDQLYCKNCPNQHRPNFATPTYTFSCFLVD